MEEDIDSILKNSLSEEQYKSIISLLNNKDESISIMSKALERQEEQIKELHEKNQYLYLEMIHYKNLAGIRAKMKFARQKEALSEQLSLFDDIETNQEEGELEERIAEAERKPEEKKEIQRRRNLVNFENSDLPIKRFDVRLNDDKLIDINSDIIKKTLCVMPARHYIKETHYHQYRDKDTGEIVKASEERGALGKSMVSEEVLSEIINDKVLKSLPLYRQEKAFKLEGIEFSRQCMSNLIFQSSNAIRPLVDKIDEYIRSADINRTDETELNVLEYRKEKATTSKHNSYIWLFSTGNGHHPAYSYRLGPGRDKRVLVDYFKTDRKRYLISDGYNAYQGMENITNVYCLPHIRRCFYQLINKNSSKESKAVRIVNLIGEIYHEERKIKEEAHGYEEIKASRNIKELPILEKLEAYIDGFKDTLTTKSGLYKAVRYFKDHITGFKEVFKDGRLELDNNASERGIKDIVIGRKNWMFANTRKGADITLMYYSLVKTAMENKLNPVKYITKLLKELPYKEDKNFDYENYLPWNITLDED